MLFLKHGLLLCQPFAALSFERGIIALVQVQFQMFDMHDRIGDAVEKITVMRDQQQGALKPLQPLFEPDGRVQIQMVGRFVQQ